MKIIFLGPSHPYRGGIATFSDRLAMECQQSGHAVELITFSLQYPSVLFPGKTQFADEPKPHDLSVRRMINSINPFSWFKTGRYIHSQKPDLVIVRYWIPFLAPALGTILRLAKSNKITKVICIADNIHPHESRWGDRILTHYFNTPVDGYVLMSEEVKNDFLSLGFNQPYVVQPHPLFDQFGTRISQAEARKSLRMDPAKPVLLFFGLIRKYKGLDLLLEAMANERIRAAAVQLLVAGECYEDSEKYHSLIQRLNLSDRVRFINAFIPNDQVALYFSAADALVQPYRNASQSGVTPLAMHFDTPMIVTDVGGLKESVIHEKTGIVTHPTSDSIATGILRFFELQTLNNFKKNIENEKHKYSWSSFFNRLMELYERIQAKSIGLFLLLLFITSFAMGQPILRAEQIQLLKKKEDSLVQLGTQMIRSEDVATRFRSDSAFTRILVRALREKNSFYYPFESLSTISRIYPMDSSFRIFTWQVSKDEDTHRRHGAIQMRTSDGSLQLFPLIDRSIIIENQADTITNNEWWIGAIYYGIVERMVNSQKVYTLLGYDEYSIRSTRKIIEVLSFKNGKPVFGGDYFSFKNDSVPQSNRSRFWIEYKKNGNGRVIYDKELDMIIYDHLISETNEPAKKYTYIPDGDYEGFRWDNGKWVHINKVFDQKLEDGKAPVERPLNEKKIPPKKSGG